MNIFNKENLLLFHPEGVEFINDILSSINLYKDYTLLSSRRKGLEVINKLFELDLIEVFHWGKYEGEFKGKKLSIFEKMMYIQELWFIGAIL